MSYDSFPTLAGEIAAGVIEGRPRFPFISWAQQNRFAHPEWAVPFLRNCGSAAEAYLVRPFLLREGARLVGDQVVAGDTRLALQVRVRSFRVDLVAYRGDMALAIEVDGMGFHHRSSDQVARDYLRERRIVFSGYTVIRFTAVEAFRDSAECWRQIDAILTSRAVARPA